MRTVLALMNRNRKLFFKDKGMLFTSMITPVILIVLYATFLANVFRDSFTSAIPDMITISDKLINGTVAAQLTASLLAVSCITVTFCVNLTMVQDKANGTRKDFDVSPVSKRKIYLGYFLSTVANSLMVNGFAFILCLGYLFKMGWYMNIADVMWVLFDMILLVLFGSTISSIISFPLTTQGQLSAVGTIVSAGYGFICGAYMPISNFGLGEILSLIRFSISLHTVSGCSIPHTDPSSFIPNQISPSPKLLYALTVFKNVFVIVDLNSRFFFSFTIITLFVFLYHITNEAQMKRKILRFICASSFVYLQSISRAHTPRNSSSSSCAEA